MSKGKGSKIGALHSEIVTFGGYGEGIAGEIKAIQEGIRFNNSKGGWNGSIRVIPKFMWLEISSGDDHLIFASRFARNSCFHVEMIGDSFGDTSYNMQTISYFTAKDLGIPTIVIAKLNRTAKNPGYAHDFLSLAERNEVDFYGSSASAYSVFKERYKEHLYWGNGNQPQEKNAAGRLLDALIGARRGLMPGIGTERRGIRVKH